MSALAGLVHRRWRMPSFVENVWWAVHQATWAPRWEIFQLAAVVAGAVVVALAHGGKLLGAYATGIVLAVLGAAASASGGEYVAYLVAGAHGAPPELEVAGFGAIAGLVVGFVAAARFGRAKEKNAWLALDALAPAIGLMIALARVGCFFAGCDFGSPTSSPWALRYPPLTPAFKAQLDAGLVAVTDGYTLPVHPTQLYESLAGLAVFAIVMVWPDRGALARPGARFSAALASYLVARFVIDFVRGDLARGALELTTTQSLSAAALALLAACWTLRLQRDRGRATPPSRSAQLSGKPS